jgi:hypothetical protein
MSDLEPIIERSLGGFLTHVRDVGWHGRENEAVSLYAFGFLQRECVPGGPLVDATQIGIEVGAAPAPVKSARSRVRKDLVIWPQPGMNAWFPRGTALNNPSAILEWKVRRRDAAPPRGSGHDAAWLRAHSGANAACVCYAVELNLCRKVPTLVVTRFREGRPTVVAFK